MTQEELWRLMSTQQQYNQGQFGTAYQGFNPYGGWDLPQSMDITSNPANYSGFNPYGVGNLPGVNTFGWKDTGGKDDLINDPTMQPVDPGKTHWGDNNNRPTQPIYNDSKYPSWSSAGSGYGEALGQAVQNPSPTDPVIVQQQQDAWDEKNRLIDAGLPSGTEINAAGFGDRYRGYLWDQTQRAPRPTYLPDGIDSSIQGLNQDQINYMNMARNYALQGGAGVISAGMQNYNTMLAGGTPQMRGALNRSLNFGQGFMPHMMTGVGDVSTGQGMFQDSYAGNIPQVYSMENWGDYGTPLNIRNPNAPSTARVGNRQFDTTGALNKAMSGNISDFSPVLESQFGRAQRAYGDLTDKATAAYARDVLPQLAEAQGLGEREAQKFMEEIAPELRSGAISSGQYGGSRDNLNRQMAAERIGKEIARQGGNIGLAATLGAGGLSDQLASGANKLGESFNQMIGEQGYNAYESAQNRAINAANVAGSQDATEMGLGLNASIANQGAGLEWNNQLLTRDTNMGNLDMQGQDLGLRSTIAQDASIQNAQARNAQNYLTGAGIDLSADTAEVGAMQNAQATNTQNRLTGNISTEDARARRIGIGTDAFEQGQQQLSENQMLNPQVYETGMMPINTRLNIGNMQYGYDQSVLDDLIQGHYYDQDAYWRNLSMAGTLGGVYQGGPIEPPKRNKDAERMGAAMTGAGVGAKFGGWPAVFGGLAGYALYDWF